MAVTSSRVKGWCAGLAAGGVLLSVASLPPDASAAPAAVSGVRYRYVAIPALGSNVFGTRDEAVAVNAAGEVVGSSTAVGGNHAFTWQGGHLKDLGTLRSGFAESGALGLDDRGDVVGATQVNGPGDTGQHAFVSRLGPMVDLGTGYTGVGSGSAATAVNDSGQVVGYHYATQASPLRAVT